MKYVVAFNGPLDRYELPAALAQNHRLEALVTDLYLAPATRRRLNRFDARLAKRGHPDLPARCVESQHGLFALQALMRAMRLPVRQRVGVYGGHVDRQLSRRAGKLALTRGAGLLLYSGYAREAFELTAGSVPRILFVYHPSYLASARVSMA